MTTGASPRSSPTAVLLSVLVLTLTLTLTATAAAALPTPARQAQLDLAESLATAKLLGVKTDDKGNLAESYILVSKAAADKVWRGKENTKYKYWKQIDVDEEVFRAEVANGLDDAVAACVLRGLPVFTLKDVVRSSERWASRDVEDRHDWITSVCLPAEIGFISYFYDHTVNVTWVRPDSGKPDPAYTHRLSAGEKNTLWINSYIGHEWLVEDGKGLRKVYKVKFPSIHILGPKPDYAALKRTIPEGSKLSRVRNELERVTQVERVFTDVGFKKIKCPRALWGEVSTYWNNNKGHSHRATEEWLDSGFFVNWHEVNQHLVVPPMMQKRHWQEIFRPYVEAWVRTPLEATDIYGIRTYYDGAWLANHVDREHTHAASAILNVEQVNVTEPWLVHIWDIHGKRHLVTLEPGYLLFYESARCMHGRPVPLQGAEYTNIFIHYRPTNNPFWFRDPRIGNKGPDVSKFFDPAQAATHDSGLVGAEAREYFKNHAVDRDEEFRDEL